MQKELEGQEVGGWTLAECIGHGKSALVFRARRAGQDGAVKIFDRELVERFGKAPQRERVLRERSLVGKHHPHLIEILDAGEDDGRDLFFVVMALFPGKNLAEVLAQVPATQTHSLIAQVASAARFLEGLGLAHRDIKPENIGVSADFSTAVLLDLGVLRPVGFSTITDQDGQLTFVGTLQYSPPELLQREEQDSSDGWRAVTFYQLGGVLHDLITRKPLFADFLTPYGRLVEAVSHRNVTIDAAGIAPELRMLAQDCLVKDPHQRLQLVTWERFEKAPAAHGDMAALRERIAQRRRSAAVTAAPQTAEPTRAQRDAVAVLRNRLERILRDACHETHMPPFSVRTNDSEVAKLSIFFAPSRAHAVSVAFAVIVDGRITDVDSDVIAVQAAAVAAATESGLPSEAPADRLAQVFHGVRADDVLAVRLADVLLVALDWAQEHPLQDEASPTWLHLPAEEG